MARSLSNVLVHFIFSTKNRFPFLTNAGIRSRMHAYLAQVFRGLRSPAIEVGGTPDHVHILCSLGRDHAISEIIRKCKANSSSWIKTIGGMLAKFAWQAGYGAFSISPCQIESTRAYIRNQENHHRLRIFQEEYLAFLDEYGIAYDERYLWR